MLGYGLYIYHPSYVGATMADIYPNLGASSIGWYHPVILLLFTMPWDLDTRVDNVHMSVLSLGKYERVAWSQKGNKSDGSNRNLRLKPIRMGFCIGLSIAYLCNGAQSSVI
jgi:hypothetical protein